MFESLWQVGPGELSTEAPVWVLLFEDKDWLTLDFQGQTEESILKVWN